LLLCKSDKDPITRLEPNTQLVYTLLVACRLLTYLMYCSLYSSLLTVTVLSVQRYLQVMNLQNCLDRAGRRRLLVLLWLVTMILSIPALVIRQVIKDQHRMHGTSCTDSHAPPSQLVAVLLPECLVGFVSISVVAFSYIGVQRKVTTLQQPTDEPAHHKYHCDLFCPMDVILHHTCICE